MIKKLRTRIRTSIKARIPAAVQADLEARYERLRVSLLPENRGQTFWDTLFWALARATVARDKAEERRRKHRPVRKPDYLGEPDTY